MSDEQEIYKEQIKNTIRLITRIKEEAELEKFILLLNRWLHLTDSPSAYDIPNTAVGAVILYDAIVYCFHEKWKNSNPEAFEKEQERLRNEYAMWKDSGDKDE